ncbi:MAG: hypothetical protein GY839_12580 [candidate division Zixibacteria bacterium]|nr:hypothetical protein [candidate division Zixibacteria bacterium]
MSRALVFTLTIIALCITSVSATIINVPVDQVTIQQGIDSSSNGDTVLVQPGVYFENINFNGHNIVLGSLYLTTEDSSYVSQTIIDGDSAGSVITFESGEDSTTLLTGFTIQHGFADSGGGIVCNYTDPKISHNNIIYNYAQYGGGLFWKRSTLYLISCVIRGNIAEQGGGIHGIGDTSVVDSCVIENNTAVEGGGIYERDGAPYFSARISNSSIISNTADYGGGFYCDRFPNVTNSIINQNFANIDGGGCYFSQQPNLISCAISENIAGNNGGGIYVEYGHPAPYISGCLFTKNRAFRYGGAIDYYAFDGFLDIVNSTFFQNKADSAGGAIHGMFDQANIINCIFWADSAAEENELDDYLSSPSRNVDYCDVEGGWPGEGNIDAYPVFCDIGNENFYLSSNSPCIGAGEGGVDIGAFGAGCDGLSYLPSDVNMAYGIWPPQVIGGDVTYFVNYFRGMPSSVPCPLDGFWCSADVNGDCIIIGSDVTRLVHVFRTGGDLYRYCADYPPAWLTPDDLPVEAPEGWPNCEE